MQRLKAPFIFSFELPWYWNIIGKFSISRIILNISILLLQCGLLRKTTWLKMMSNYKKWMPYDSYVRHIVTINNELLSFHEFYYITLCWLSILWFFVGRFCVSFWLHCHLQYVCQDLLFQGKNLSGILYKHSRFYLACLFSQIRRQFKTLNDSPET